MLKAEKIELLEDEITELGFVIREKNVDIRSLKLKLHKIDYLVRETSENDCKIKDEILEIINEEDWNFIINFRLQ